MIDVSSSESTPSSCGDATDGNAASADAIAPTPPYRCRIHKLAATAVDPKNSRSGTRHIPPKILQKTRVISVLIGWRFFAAPGGEVRGGLRGGLHCVCLAMGKRRRVSLRAGNTRSAAPWYASVFPRLQALIDEPEKFVVASEALAAELRDVLKVVYDNAGQAQYGPLPELVVDQMDSEQIWEEIELRAEPLLDDLKQRIRLLETAASSAPAEHLDSRPAGPAQEAHGNEHSSDNDSQEYGDEDDALESDVLDDDEYVANNEDSPVDDDEDEEAPVRNGEDEPVNDVFFNVESMERFADEMEDDALLDDLTNGNDDDDDQDEDDEADDDAGLTLLREMRDDDNDDTVKYDDFFDKPEDDKGANVAGDVDDEDDEFADLSRFQREQAKLAKQIAVLEQRNVAKRSWELMGEARASDRPADSLVDAHLEFEMADKHPELITETVTANLEDLVRQRIRDGAYDDIERTAEPTPKAFKADDAREMETDKSQVGLAEIYEKEYVAKATGVTDDDEKLSSTHKDIASLFAQLCYKLDALSNFHFTPKVTVPDVAVRPNVPSIAMEEAVPIAVSAGRTVAPEEVYRPETDRQPVAETEQTREERRAGRRARKVARRKAAAQQQEEERVKAKFDARFKTKLETKSALKTIADDHGRTITKGDAAHDAGEFTRSSAVFRKIQDSEAARRRGGAGARPPAKASGPPASTFKL